MSTSPGRVPELLRRHTVLFSSFLLLVAIHALGRRLGLRALVAGTAGLVREAPIKVPSGTFEMQVATPPGTSGELIFHLSEPTSPGAARVPKQQLVDNVIPKVSVPVCTK